MLGFKVLEDPFNVSSRITVRREGGVGGKTLTVINRHITFMGYLLFTLRKVK